jgi:hypothetical protein
MQRNRWLYFGIMAFCTFLSSCDKAREAFGLNRHQPDEFTTPPRTELQAPMSLDLPPPQPGAPNRGVVAADIKARELLSAQSTEEATSSPIEEALLASAGAEGVQSDIRQTINQEARANRPPKTIINKALFWQKPKAEGDVIDPYKERKILEERQQRVVDEN